MLTVVAKIPGSTETTSCVLTHGPLGQNAVLGSAGHSPFSGYRGRVLVADVSHYLSATKRAQLNSDAFQNNRILVPTMPVLRFFLEYLSGGFYLRFSCAPRAILNRTSTSHGQFGYRRLSPKGLNHINPLLITPPCARTLRMFRLRL